MLPNKLHQYPTSYLFILHIKLSIELVCYTHDAYEMQASIKVNLARIVGFANAVVQIHLGRLWEDLSIPKVIISDISLLLYNIFWIGIPH